MSRNTDSYAPLMREFTPRPIHTEADYDATVEMMDKLAVRDEDSLDAGERDYLDLLTMLISKYDEQHVFPDRKTSPLAALKYLMSQSGMNVSALGKVIGSQSAASMIVGGRRSISKAQAFMLAERFAMAPDLFLDPPSKSPRKRAVARA
jgi:HTH-type transcriptional regulator/antitoxin HigA